MIPQGTPAPAWILVGFGLDVESEVDGAEVDPVTALIVAVCLAGVLASALLGRDGGGS